MPKVMIDPAQYERFPLKTAPADPTIPGDEDGYVMLRPLPFGMKLTRRDKATKMSMEANAKRGNDEGQKIELETLNEWAVAHDFAYCIGNHNLLDLAGNPIDFTNAMALKLLDPKVGTELETLVNTLNGDEDEETLEAFTERLTSSSPVEVQS